MKKKITQMNDSIGNTFKFEILVKKCRPKHLNKETVPSPSFCYSIHTFLSMKL